MAPSDSKAPTNLNPKLNLLSKSAIFLLAAYQLLVSPILGPRCRFYPTCSSYAKQAFEEQGFSRGCILTLKRLAKCHPFNKGGIDEVPAEKMTVDNLFYRKARIDRKNIDHAQTTCNHSH